MAERTEFIAALREVADFYETRPEVPVPDALTISAISSYAVGAAGFALAARALAPCEKDFQDTVAYLRRRFGPVTVEVFAGRDLVCERKVVGTRTVTKPVMEQVGEESVTEEVVEWECSPILKADA